MCDTLTIMSQTGFPAPVAKPGWTPDSATPWLIRVSRVTGEDTALQFSTLWLSAYIHQHACKHSSKRIHVHNTYIGKYIHSSMQQADSEPCLEHHDHQCTVASSKGARNAMWQHKLSGRILRSASVRCLHTRMPAAGGTRDKSCMNVCVCDKEMHLCPLMTRMRPQQQVEHVIWRNMQSSKGNNVHIIALVIWLSQNWQSFHSSVHSKLAGYARCPRSGVTYIYLRVVSSGHLCFRITNTYDWYIRLNIRKKNQCKFQYEWM